MRRSFLFRLALAFAGMVLLCAVLYLGIGWALWSRQEWLYDQIVENPFLPCTDLLKFRILPVRTSLP